MANYNLGVARGSIRVSLEPVKPPRKETWLDKLLAVFGLQVKR